jgi:hypothetical protein
MSIRENCDAAFHWHSWGHLLNSSDSTLYLLRKIIWCRLYRFLTVEFPAIMLDCEHFLKQIWCNGWCGRLFSSVCKWLAVITPANSSLLFIQRLVRAIRSLFKRSTLDHLRLGLQGCLVTVIFYKTLVSIYHIFLTCGMSSRSFAFSSWHVLRTRTQNTERSCEYVEKRQKIINRVPGLKVSKIKKLYLGN